MKGKIQILAYDLLNLVPITQAFFDTNVVVSFVAAGLDAIHTPVFTVTQMPVAVAATLEIEFNIRLSVPITADQPIEFSFANQNVFTLSPTFVNLVRKTTDPQVTMPFCDPGLEMYSGGVCVSCINPADYPANAAACSQHP
jgi:hypothetical protein